MWKICILHNIKWSLLIILGTSFFSFGQDPTSDDPQSISLYKQIEGEIADKAPSLGKDFDNFVTYCRQKDNDTILLAGIDLITDYYIENSNYFEAIKWYSYAEDSVCKGKIGRCIKLRREFGKIYDRVGNYGEIIRLRLENLKELTANNRREAILLEHQDIGTVYFHWKKYDSVAYYFKKSLDLSRKYKIGFYEIMALNNLGLYYNETGNSKEAIRCYREGIYLLENGKVKVKGGHRQLALLKGNLGGILLDQGNSEEGIKLLQVDLKNNLYSSEPKLAINASLELAKYYYSKKQYDDAIAVIKSTLVIESKINEPLMFVESYHQLFRNALAKGNVAEAQRYYLKFNELRQLTMTQNENERVAIEKSLLGNIFNTQLEIQRREIDLNKKEKEALETQSKFQRLRFWLISIVLLLIVVFGVWYYKKRVSVLKITKELAEKNLRLEQIEKERIDNELRLKNKDLTDFAIDISRKQEVLGELKDKLYELKNTKIDEVETKKNISELIQYTNNNLIVDNQLNEFQSNIEEVNYRFFETLKERFPELTELDKQICGLIRLGLSNKEIATMRNVSYKAVRMARYRLRKKLNLDEEEDIVDFLKSI